MWFQIFACLSVSWSSVSLFPFSLLLSSLPLLICPCARTATGIYSLRVQLWWGWGVGGGWTDVIFPVSRSASVLCVWRADGWQATVSLPRGAEPAIREACEAEEGGYERHRQKGRCDPARAGLREETLGHGWSQRRGRQTDRQTRAIS